MRSERRRPRRPLPWNPLSRAETPAGPEEPSASLDPETRVDEGVVAGAARERHEWQIESEIERLRETEGGFEEKYHASWDEFQARYAPGEDPQADEEYLEWAHVAEQLRQLRADLKRLAQPAKPPAGGQRERSAGREAEQGTDLAREVREAIERQVERSKDKPKA
jgi:hypothetical protein